MQAPHCKYAQLAPYILYQTEAGCQKFPRGIPDRV